MDYRREIDGLRAVAVVPVILFHAGFTVFSGGFVGVDVFFVISGYLITTIILTERREGRFSILRFYERRARRILPALFLVIACTIPFAWLWMYPEQLAEYARSVAATALFISNVHFWEHTDYFATRAELQPLLHTWSLAVEEQYYLLFPLLLMVFDRNRNRRLFWALVTLAALSLALSEWGWRNEPDANFFFTPSRLWELLAGSLCAIYLLDRAPKSNNPLALLGLGLIVYAIFAYDVTTPFPSVWALAPVGGTVLIILCAGSQTWVARLLSMRAFVGIGLISYSAYLWHQPLFAFARLRSLHEPALWLMVLLAAASLALAALSWRFVEQPFRQKPTPLFPGRGLFLSLSAAGLLGFFAVGWTIDDADGVPMRIAPNGQPWAEVALDPRLARNYGLSNACSEDVARAVAHPECRSSDQPKVLLWGDSYAMHLALGLVADGNASGLGIRQITKSACSPILNFSQNNKGEGFGAECAAFNDAVMAWLSDHGAGIETVVMSSPYNTRQQAVFDRDGRDVDNTDNQYVYRQMRATADAIRKMGKRPVFVSAPPVDGSDIGSCLGIALASGIDLSACDFETSDYPAWLTDTYALLTRLSETEEVAFLSDLMCDAGQCRASIGDTFLYRDTGHLSVEGTKLLGRDYGLFEFITSQ